MSSVRSFLKSTSGLATIVFFFTILFLHLIWGNSSPLAWDVMGYHVYFVQAVIHGDQTISSLEFYEHIQQTYQNTETLYQFIQTPDGNFISKYSSGWAVLNAPFLIVGHWISGWTGQAQDGFSRPYQIAATTGSLFYTLLGLIYMRKVLLQLFSERLTIVLMAVLVFATNYLHMNYGSTSMSHILIFPFYAILINATLKFHSAPSIKYSLIIGWSLGIMMLIRPTEIIAAAIPLLFGVTSIKAFILRIKQVFTTKHYYIAIIVTGLVYSVQLLFWKSTTGEFLFYTYLNPGEGLDLATPYLKEFLLSYRKGWFVYTPVMLLALVGLIRIWKKFPQLALGVVLFFVLNIYLLSSWTTWWYAASFSQRALVQSYPIALLLIGAAIQDLNKPFRYTMCGIITLCACLNLFQTWQYQNGIIHMDRMTKSYYFSVFGQTSAPTAEQSELLLIDHGKSIFDDIQNYQLIRTVKVDDGYPKWLTKENPYSGLKQIPFDSISTNDHVWIIAKVATPYYSPDSINLLTCFSMKYNDEDYFWRAGASRGIDQYQDSVYFSYLTPHLRTREDKLTGLIWLEKGDSVLINGFEFDIWEKKN